MKLFCQFARKMMFGQITCLTLQMRSGAQYRKEPSKSHSCLFLPLRMGNTKLIFFDNNKDYLIKTPSKGLSIKKTNVLIIGSSTKTIISRFDNVDNPHLLAARQEMMSWRFLHLNPTDLRLPSIKRNQRMVCTHPGWQLWQTSCSNYQAISRIRN